MLSSCLRSCYTCKKYFKYILDSVSELIKETKSVTMNCFRKKYFLLKSFVKVELSYEFTVKVLSTAENAWKSELSDKNRCFFLLLVIIYVPPIILDR